ncbi:hypothetical protein M0R45_027907 [Rubus argutus]|uniref:Subtilisin-like protease fibronectin type-III domain-containing protein n=1 Tax=Rubus argutus TaxID=59490 RepID=A0AAW1W665_RUBAR
MPSCTSPTYSSHSVKVLVTAPKGSTVTVSPEILNFEYIYEKQSYTVTIKYKGKKKNRKVSFGELVWVEENGKYKVRSPIVVSPIV